LINTERSAISLLTLNHTLSELVSTTMLWVRMMKKDEKGVNNQYNRIRPHNDNGPSTFYTGNYVLKRKGDERCEEPFIDRWLHLYLCV
jgi:hypothetical protein